MTINAATAAMQDITRVIARSGARRGGFFSFSNSQCLLKFLDIYDLDSSKQDVKLVVSGIQCSHHSNRALAVEFFDNAVIHTKHKPLF